MSHFQEIADRAQGCRFSEREIINTAQWMARCSAAWQHSAAILALLISIWFAMAMDAQDDIAAPDVLRSQFAKSIHPLLETYCMSCHDVDTVSTVRLDTIGSDIAPNNIGTWTRVKNMLDVGSMPPKGKARPSRSESEQLLAWIGASLDRYDAIHKENGGDTPIRRINNRSYANMVRTLLGVPAQGIEDFPADGQMHGFDTVGAGLYTTSNLYECYWQCAQRTLNLAIPGLVSRPASSENRQLFRSNGSTFDDRRRLLDKMITDLQKTPRRCDRIQLGYLALPEPLRKDVDFDPVGHAVAAHFGARSFEAVVAKKIDWLNDQRCVDAIIVALKSQIPRVVALEADVPDFQPVSVALTGFQPYFLNRKIQQPGRYIISAHVCLLDQRYPLPVAIEMNDAIVDSFMLYNPQSDPLTHETAVYCRSGTPKFAIQAAFPTAIYSASYMWLHFFVDYAIARYGLSPQQAVEMQMLNQNHTLLVAPADPRDPGSAPKQTDLPSILCSEFSVRGPIYDCWPTPATVRIFTRGLQSPPSREYAKEIVRSFMKRAYVMRDCDDEMTQPYADLIMTNYQSGKDFVAAVKFGLAAILCSPDFLYLEEGQRTAASQRKPLSAFELARRLSYFLWSDLPDDALLESAASGALLDRKELADQASRMLKDDRSHAFREAFTTQWLRIDRLEQIPFSLELLPDFNIVLLKSAKKESVAFFSELLDKNLSVLNFIDSDFAMLDGCMAQHYGIPGIVGEAFRRVQLPPGSHRGGVLTQASVLMATSNGVVGSLVRRGVFVMDRLLGVSPGEPPPNVQALDKTMMANQDGTPLTPRGTDGEASPGHQLRALSRQDRSAGRGVGELRCTGILARQAQAAATGARPQNACAVGGTRGRCAWHPARRDAIRRA